MMVIDAGPMIAILDRSSHAHGACKRVLEGLGDERLITTWPALTEAAHVLTSRRGIGAWLPLLEMVMTGAMEVTAVDSAMLGRIRELCWKYRDLPMDLADATLVALCEAQNDPRIFTLDSDFAVYRFKGRRAFEVWPETRR